MTKKKGLAMTKKRRLGMTKGDGGPSECGKIVPGFMWLIRKGGEDGYFFIASGS
jgi:hypothetical protein